MKKGAIVGVIVGVAVVGALSAIAVIRFMKPKDTSVEIALPVVELAQPEPASIELYRQLTGTVEPSDVVYIYPKAAGEVKGVFAKVGDYVSEGQELCEIDTKQVDGARLALEGAQITLNDANTNLSRMEALYRSGDISAQAIEQVRSQARGAQLDYDGKKLAYDNQLEFSKITAPISGMIETFDIEVFDTVSQQVRVCVIAGEGSRVVSFSVPEKIVGQLEVGEPIQIEKNGTDYAGVISEIDAMVDAQTGLFKIKAAVEGGEVLPTGTIVKLSVISERAENVMTLPVDTVYYAGGDAYVYTYDNGTVHRVPVEVGIYDSERIQILSGVSDGDRVIATWTSELFEGSKVQAAGEPAVDGTDEEETSGAGTDAAGPDVAKTSAE